MHGYKIIMAGGGTGGHLFPGIAVAQEFKRRIPKAEILFIGTGRPVEVSQLARYDFPLKVINVEGIKGRGLYERAKAAVKAGVAIISSILMLKREKPALVFGLGGYSAGPVVLAASLLSIPCVLHEQNMIPGLTNKWLAKRVDRIFLTYEDINGIFARDKSLLTGNPLRHEFIEQGLSPFPEGTMKILVLGGSQGARLINSIMPAALELIEKYRPSINILHQCGEGLFEETKENYKSLSGPGYKVVPFIENMFDAYRESSFVISRAGATTLSELTAAGRGAILIPYPYAAANHQEFNARQMEKANAAEVMLENDITPQKLAEKIKDLITDHEKILNMARASKAMARPDAAAKIVEECLCLLKERG